MRSFDVPLQYRSPLISGIKNRRKAEDKLKKDFAPAILHIGSLQVTLARHFGFCYGVENAIEIAFRAVAENPDKRIFLLGEMIHNPGVNADLQNMGIRFIMDTSGKMLVNWYELSPTDIVIIPAFGTTLEIEKQLHELGIDPKRYETTCPFVEKVWNRAGKIGEDGYTIIIHGKPGHEETRATFSHSKAFTPTVVVKDMQQAEQLARYIRKELHEGEFYRDFKGQYSVDFDVTRHLERIGVVNQTTMLASETQAIADYLKKEILHYYQTPAGKTAERFADTRDTLCYATNDNQGAVINMLQAKADFALVIGGYNSSNTSHLVELCEQVLPVYFIRDENCISDNGDISHYDLHTKTEQLTQKLISVQNPISIMITSGASCPDALVERVIERLAKITGNGEAYDQLCNEWGNNTQ